jgi:hypothetical protein
MCEVIEMKKVIVIFAIVALCLVGCEGERSAEYKQTVKTDKILSEINRQIGLPNLTNFQQKKILKMVYELCDKEDLVCFAYIKSDYQGKLVFIGKCVGFGVPFSAQYTNPSKFADTPTKGWDYRVVPQADPNGLYMPTSSSATWLLMVDPKTSEPRPVYLEPEIVVSPFPLHQE